MTVQMRFGWWWALASSWHELVKWSLDMGFQGLENLALIPGTVGGAPIQNIGAYGAELADVFEAVRVFDLAHGKRLTLGTQDCHFSYRDSIFTLPFGKLADLLGHPPIGTLKEAASGP